MEYFYVYFAENVFFSSPRRVRREYRLNKINYFERARALESRSLAFRVRPPTIGCAGVGSYNLLCLILTKRSCTMHACIGTRVKNSSNR